MGYAFLQNLEFFFCSEKKCQDYIKHHLRAPTRAQVVGWARQFKFPAADIDRFNESILLRHELGKKTKGLSVDIQVFLPPPFFLGPDVGSLSNTKRWKKSTMASYRSPFFVQADVGKKKIFSKKSAGYFSGLKKTIQFVFFGRKNNRHKN